MSPTSQQPQIDGPIIVASNRGPVSFHLEDGHLVAERGSGGLVTALAGLLFQTDTTWLSAAMTDGDREIAARDAPIDVEPQGHARFLSIPPDRYSRYYNDIANRILWFLHHYLFPVAYEPAFDRSVEHAWEDFREVNRLFAEALAKEGDRDPVYLIQDYHLALVPAMLRELRPDARITHFSHTPFCGPTYMRFLPERLRAELLRGMLGADVLGFQAEQWAENFLLDARALPETRTDQRRHRIEVEGRTVLVRAYPIALDPVPLRAAATSDRVKTIREELEAWRGGTRLLLRVDRFELSKNIDRGFQAFGIFLKEHPEWRGKVKFLALLPLSRTVLPEYKAYAKHCMQTVDSINRRYGRKDWTPIEVRTDENYEQAVAAYGLYDALLVNPVFDGMNLVAMEGPLVNRRRGSLILSRNAGAFARLGRHAIGVNPFDLSETAQAILQALEMPPSERAGRSRSLARAVLSSNPSRWLTAQLRDLATARRLTGQTAEQRNESRRSVDEHVRHVPQLGGGLGSAHGDLGRHEP